MRNLQGYFSRTFQVLEFSRKKIQDSPGGVGTLASIQCSLTEFCLLVCECDMFCCPTLSNDRNHQTKLADFYHPSVIAFILIKLNITTTNNTKIKQQ